VAGEAVWAVPPLKVPALDEAAKPSRLKHYDAVRLFTDRARMASPGFELTEQNAVPVAGVCTALDGIPLAMELAASRVKVLSVEDLAARLGGRFELLHDGRRPLRPHHETLWSTMDWSHGLLDEKERVLFRRLSVFRGGWTLDAAEAVCAGDGLEECEIVHLLEQLVDKSVVEVHGSAGGRRYRMLQTLRLFGEKKLEEGLEADEVWVRHLGYFAAMAETAKTEIRGPGQAEWLERIEADYGNVRAAIHHATACRRPRQGLQLVTAIPRFWVTRGKWSEGEALLAGLLEVTDGATPDLLRADSLDRRGSWLRMQGQHNRAREHHEASLGIRQEADDQSGIAGSLRGLGVVAYEEGELETSRRLLEESLLICRRESDARATAKTLTSLGLTVIDQADWTYARELCSESLSIMQQVRDAYGVALALSALGAIAARFGEHDEERRLHELSLTARREIGDRFGEACALHNIGMVDGRQGDYASAERRHSSALEIFRHLGSRRRVSSCLLSLGNVAKNRGDLAQAEGHYRESLSIARALGDRRGVALATINLGIVASKRGDSSCAQARYQEGLEMCLSIGDTQNAAGAMVNLGEIARMQGDYDSARAHLGNSLELFRELGSRRGEAHALSGLASAALWQGDHESAQAWYEEAVPIRTALGDKRGLAVLREGMGLVALCRDDWEAARESLEESLKLFSDISDSIGVTRAVTQLAVVAARDGDMVAARSRIHQALQRIRDLGLGNEAPESIEVSAALAAVSGDHLLSSRLLGYAERLRSSSQAPPREAALAHVAGASDAARTALGPTAFDVAHSEGGALTLHEAVAYALGEVMWDELADEVAARLQVGEGDAGSQPGGS
jgi:predicted ATPase/Tfp pilus assembly protein PilF